MSNRIAGFQLMELIEQELAFAAEADLAMAQIEEQAIQETRGAPPGEEFLWRGIEDQMKYPMPRKR